MLNFPIKITLKFLLKIILFFKNLIGRKFFFFSSNKYPEYAFHFAEIRLKKVLKNKSDEKNYGKRLL